MASDLSRGSPALRVRFLSPQRGKGGLSLLDVTKADEAVDVARGHEVTRVVHLAGLQVPFCAADPARGASVNVVGTVNVFEAARKANQAVGLSYASSGAVFGDSSLYLCTRGTRSRTGPRPYPLRTMAPTM